MIFRNYLNRYAFKEKWIENRPSPNLGLIIVIPSYNETDLLMTLESLLACDPVDQNAEIIVVINTSDKDSSKIITDSRRQFDSVSEWSKQNSNTEFRFHAILQHDIPYKIAGPGYARKIGMDEAVRRFEEIKNAGGIIVSLDADTVVEKNYLQEILKHWHKHPNTNGISIQFEHKFHNCKEKIKAGIINYELHLRYYINAQSFSGFPHAFQTVGSSFAVSTRAYARQGGMNKRKAGEDFYFLHKIIPLGEYYNLNSTKVFPSPRPSLRVPFGTGRTITDFLKQKDYDFKTYNFQTFKDLKTFLGKQNHFFKSPQEDSQRLMETLPESIRDFLKKANFSKDLHSINKNTANIGSFTKAFFRWFDAFKLMKYVHFARDNFHPDQDVKMTLDQFMSDVNQIDSKNMSMEELLSWFRSYDARSGQKDY